MALGGLITKSGLIKFRDTIADKFLVAHETLGQVNGFIFSLQLNTTVQKQAETTDYYVEDLSAIQDHIAVKPLQITLSGYVGEKTLNSNAFTDQFLQKINTRLINIGTPANKLTSYATQLYSLINAAKQDNDTLLAKASNLYKIALMATGHRTKQQQAYAYFEALMNNRALVSVVTPYDTFLNMAVIGLQAEQGAQSTMLSNFSVTLKQISTTKTHYETYKTESTEASTGAITTNAVSTSQQPETTQGYRAQQIADEAVTISTGESLTQEQIDYLNTIIDSTEATEVEVRNDDL